MTLLGKEQAIGQKQKVYHVAPIWTLDIYWKTSSEPTNF